MPLTIPARDVSKNGSGAHVQRALNRPEVQVEIDPQAGDLPALVLLDALLNALALNAAEALAEGLRLGMTHIDTAELYTGSEETIAPVVAGRRDDVVLATKFGMRMSEEDDRHGPRGSRRYVRHAVEASLDRLGRPRSDILAFTMPGFATSEGMTLKNGRRRSHSHEVRAATAPKTAIDNPSGESEPNRATTSSGGRPSVSRRTARTQTPRR